jgi:hypothetical protein
MKEFPVVFITSTKFADYYAVGAARQITVSVRAKSGLLLCHTCRANKCEHTPSVELYVSEHETPELAQWHRDRADRVGTLDLSQVEL